MEIKRKKYQGVLNILSFNRHYYYIGLVMLISIITCLQLLKCPEFILYIIISAFTYGLVIPLIVSAYVYDFSGYYNLSWLKENTCQDSESNHIVNINAGFDETSHILKNHFPKSHLSVFDFFNPKQHTEPAIVRARKVSLVYPNTQQTKTDLIPLNDNAVDTVFLLSAVHEIRSYKEKVTFLKECYRICKPNGNIIMVEHLRDFSNFLAFSVGFTHFFSKTTWLQAYKEAGFSSFEETKLTPFMSIFNFKP